MSGIAEMTREERDALIFQLKAEGQLSQTEIGQRVGLSGTRVGRILNDKGGAPSNGGTRSVAPRAMLCARPGCGAALKSEHWVYSTHTGLHYCWPGEGCWLWSEKKRAKMRHEHVAPKEVASDG